MVVPLEHRILSYKALLTLVYFMLIDLPKFEFQVCFPGGSFRKKKTEITKKLFLTEIKELERGFRVLVFKISIGISSH